MSADGEHGPERPARPGGPHLWEVRAVRDLAAIGLVALTLWVLVRLQAVVVPFVIAFVLAYLVDPVVTAARGRWGLPRALTTGLLVAALLGAVAVFAGLLVPTLQEEVERLVRRGPEYLGVLQGRYGRWLPEPPAFLRGEGAGAEGGGAGSGEVDSFVALLGQAFGVVRDVLGVTGYLVVATFLTVAAFVWFTIRFPRLPSLRRYLPRSRREELWGLLEKLEQVFAGFFRGQLVVAAFTTTVFAIGFATVGVPFWFIASLVGGTFSIIPYGQITGWALAVVFQVLEAQAGSGGIDWIGVLLGPTIVYGIMQGLETFVVTPLVQGSHTRLHPILVFACVVGGGSVGGILGVFLAIPVAASAKILLKEVVFPRLRRAADAS